MVSGEDAAEASVSSLSEYERKRIDNIVRNNARLRALGLLTAREEARSNAAARGEPLPEEDERNGIESNESSDSDSDGSYREEGQRTKKTSKKRKQPVPPTSPSRKSRRLQGQTPEGEELVLIDSYKEKRLSLREQRELWVQECRTVRLERALQVSADQAAKENPTATYEHCLMRVKTMTEKALQNRVKAIERAAGKHCVVKMAIFKSCLQDQDMWDLAELAGAALERLKANHPIPE